MRETVSNQKKTSNKNRTVFLKAAPAVFVCWSGGHASKKQSCFYKGKLKKCCAGRIFKNVVRVMGLERGVKNVIRVMDLQGCQICY